MIYKSNSKITKESIISEFETNRQHFNTIKDYMLDKDDKYYINLSSKEFSINDQTTRNSVEFLVNKIGYKKIYNNAMKPTGKALIFLRVGNNKDEFGIVYMGHEGFDFGMESEYLGDGWYFYWIGYT